MIESVDRHSNCNSCGNDIIHEPKYCPSCGAPVAYRRLTVGRLLLKTFTSIFNFELPFFDTLKWLIVDPSKVTNGYINGVRKVILSPVQLLLTVLAIYGLYQFIFSDFLEFASQSSHLVQFEGGLIEGYLHGFNDEINSGHQNQAKVFSNWLHKHDQFISTLMIPMLALMGMAFFSKIKFNFAEHLSISIYTTSLTILTSILLGAICAIIPSDFSTKVYITIYPLVNIILILWIYHSTMKSNFFINLAHLLLSYFFFLFAYILIITIGVGLIEGGVVNW